MTVVQLRDPLKRLAGGGARHTLAGAAVGELLAALEAEHAALAGWILDERGQIRRHINVFVNGERAQADTAVQECDEVHVLPAISGG
ncbi:MAG: MoaD/ThiS family protein [Actinomycetota bacterium]|nr:MoaD/ThiS family protein [Actinomycetota bacterium]